MTDTNPRDLIKLLINALKEECNWIDNPKHDQLIAKATAYLTKYEPEISTDEKLNSKSSPNNLQIRSSDLDVTITLVQQWTDEIYGGPGAVVGSDDICLAKLAAQYGADQELEACCEWLDKNVGRWEIPLELRDARRPKSATLKKQSLKHLEVMERDGYYLPEILEDLRRALEALPE